MSFGWSAGDIASVITLLVKIGSALKESGGAATDYQEAIDFLSSIEKSLNGIKKLLDENADLTWGSELNEQVVHVKAAVERFRAKIDKYELSLGADSSRSTARKIPRKVQFALMADVKDFRNAILQSQIILDGFVNLQIL
jgi:hypothetical protein